MKQKSNKVPKELQPKFDEIMAIIKAACDEQLDEEYYEMSTYLCAGLCRKRPSPIGKGRAKSWACGIVHALGYANFLFDPSSDPWVTAAELYETFGVSSSTALKKSKEIRESMKVSQFDSDWILPSIMEHNPIIWMVKIDGMPMDIRKAPRQLQEIAYNKGLIPYIPADKEGKRSNMDNVIEFPLNKKKTKKQLLDEAQELIYKADETANESKRIKLAEKALELSEDCVDAYIFLAFEYDNYEKQRELFQKAVEASKRILGKKFNEYKGDFWNVTETRPFMFAKYQLADIEWTLGNKRTAIEHLKEMIELNPNDNQGIRYILVGWLIREGEEEETEKLIKEFEHEGSPDWMYNSALYYFKKGDINKADELLKEAVKYNEFIPDYLLDKKPMPAEMPAFISMGGELEAHAYVIVNYDLWNSIVGSKEWLRRVKIL